MSEEKGRQVVSKRFFVQSDIELHKRLRVLAVQLDSSAEKLGGELLAEAVARAEIEVQQGKRKPKRK